ncbi:MAG TPA: TolC family protein, partial [Burkholderiales bacterium]|nr:TolC family protein [Burkholderiales bacterium]
GATLSIPIFDGFASAYKTSGARAQVEKQEADMLNTQQQILTEVVKSYADAVSSIKNLRSSESLLNAEQAVLASSKRRYEKGDADILELLNAQTSLADAASERIRCLAEWRSARLRLFANSGLLGREDLKSP